MELMERALWSMQWSVARTGARACCSASARSGHGGALIVWMAPQQPNSVIDARCAVVSGSLDLRKRAVMTVGPRAL